MGRVGDGLSNEDAAESDLKREEEGPKELGAELNRSYEGSLSEPGAEETGTDELKAFIEDSKSAGFVNRSHSVG